MNRPIRFFLALLPAFSVPAALAYAAEDPSIVGRYTCVGDAGNGKQYSGTVEVVAEKDTYRVTWDFGGARTEGLGIREGDVLSVSIRGDGDPKSGGVAVYRVKEDGSLAGRWSYFSWQGAVLTETWTPAGGRPGGKPAPTDPPPAGGGNPVEGRAAATSAVPQGETPDWEYAVPEKELGKLQGTWALKSEWRDGQPVEDVGRKEVVITGNEWLDRVFGSEGDEPWLSDSAIEIVAIGYKTGQPKQLRLKDGSQTKDYLYTIEGDMLTVADYIGVDYARLGPEAAGEIVGGLRIYQRTSGRANNPKDAPSAEQAGPEAEHARLQGTWVLESQADRGFDDSGAPPSVRLTIQDDMWTRVQEGEPKPMRHKFVAVGEAADGPRQFDLVVPGKSREDGTEFEGLYRLDGEKLTIGYSFIAGGRPTRLEPDAVGAFGAYEVYRREAPADRP